MSSAAASTANSVGDPPCLHVSFHQQAAKTPDATALVYADGTEITYRETQQRVLRLAKELKAVGAKANAVVAIFMEPSPDYVVAMLAILSAGAGYTPLELNYPVIMLQRVLLDAEPVAVLTHLDKRAMLPASDSTVICLDDTEHKYYHAPDLQQLLEIYNSWEPTTLDDLAFVVYSSGTTGQPKGIANPHRAPAFSYRWRFTEISDYHVGDRVACNVFFVWEALRPIMRGGAVVPVPASIIYDAEGLLEFLHRQKITEMLFTPSLMENVLNLSADENLAQRLTALKTVFLNGEVVPIALRNRCYKVLPEVRFINLYSISECHEVGAVDLEDVDLELSTKFCPIGPPCSVSPAYILDEEENPVVEGDAGELYVGGDMLAIGYLNLPELTQTRFVPNPFMGGRMYRTGDRARMLPNGHLEILGRCDFMVKIRGYSVVLGAVEAALLETVALSSCVVVADGEEGEEKHLVAYIVRAPDDPNGTRLSNFSVDQRTGSCPEIRRAVDGALPHYMVPSVFIEVESLPVSAVGAKLDRKALQAQSADRRAMLRSLQFAPDTHVDKSAGSVASGERWKRLSKYLRIPANSPLDDVVDTMPTIWENVLGREPGSLTIDSDFHENGGHSLSAARLVSLINKVFSSKLTAIKVMRGPTTVKTCADEVMASWAVVNKVIDTSLDQESVSQGSDEWSNATPAPSLGNSTTGSPTPAPDGTVEASPFRIRYNIVDGAEPNDLQVVVAVDITVKHLEDFLIKQFAGSFGVVVENLKSEIIDYGTNPDVAVAYAAQITFAETSAFFPSAEEIDVLVRLAFLKPAVFDLLNKLRELPADDPFAETETVEFFFLDDEIPSEDDKKIIQQVRDDAKLPEDVVPKTGESAHGLKDSKMILLTGATGFLGAHILAELLRKYPSATVMCLVRSPYRDAIKKNLERYNLWDDAFEQRTVVMRGNLSMPQLGLDPATLKQTASVVDGIVHCAAAVSMTAPYSMLAEANVNGTLEMIRLACSCKEGTPLVYVSSNGIFPHDKGSDEVFLENDDVDCLPDRLGAMDGYGLSKWAAEQLVIAAHKRGLPTMAIRFGNIGWQSRTGIGNALDFQGMMVNGSRRIGSRPRIKGWLLEVTPVDFASRALVALAEKPDYVKDGAIFNCVQSDFVESERVFEWMAEVDGVVLPALSYKEWSKKVSEANDDDDTEMASLKAFVVGLPEGEAYFSNFAYLDCSKFDAAIAKLEQPLKRLNLSNVAHYYRTFLLASGGTPASLLSGFVTQPVAVDPSVTSEPVGPLAGKVAIVTGASSGIGRAIVLSLVKAGAHVAMGARRMGELEKTQIEVSKSCPGSGSKTLCVRCDVTKREDVVDLVSATDSSLGPCDILVNCAGVMYFTLLKNVMWKDWDSTVDVNCKGTMYGIGSVLPGMLQRGTGHIVNITSDAGRKAMPGLGVYSGSKFFVEALSQSLRTETASTGLRVTCIQPGNVETPLLSMSTDPEGLALYGEPTGAKVLEPSDIGNAVVYAVTQPEWCAVNEILVEPREEPA